MTCLARPDSRERALRHDEQFFEEFYQASYGRTVALVAAITGSRHEAEDVAQEAYARALARWSRLRRYDLPEAWVRKVALRIAIDSRRGLRRSQSIKPPSRKRGAGGAGGRLGEPVGGACARATTTHYAPKPCPGTGRTPPAGTNSATQDK